MNCIVRWAWLGLLIAACPQVGPGEALDSGVLRVDAGSRDAGGLGGGDAGASGADSGVVAADAGHVDAGATDSGISGADSGTGTTDSGLASGDGGLGDAGLRDAGSGAFELAALDSTARGTLSLAMAIEPSAGRVGVVYFTSDGGPDFELRYVEWHDGQISVPQTVQTVQRVVGVSLAFDPISREPVAAFLGGGDGGSLSWPQNDAVVARRSGLSTLWSQRTAAYDSAPPMCSPIDQGFLVGLWSSLSFDSNGALYLGFRDGHNGAFPIQDWAASDVEVLEGAGETSLTRRCLTGDHKQAYGGRLQLAMSPSDQPGVVYDQAFGAADAPGQNVYFQHRSASGTWSAGKQIAFISNTMTGASLAGQGDAGFAIAVTDRSTSQLQYFESPNGDDWASAEAVFGSGTGGWYPSLAFDPRYREPCIAFSVCSGRNGVSENSCLQSEDELRVTQRINFNWRETLVDPAGGWSPKLGFLADGRRVVVYRVPPALDSLGVANPMAGALRIAIER